jgi:CBS domain-containing protein
MMTIEELLKHKGSGVVTAKATDTILMVAKILADHRIGAVVVEDGWMRPVGMFADRDLVRAIAVQGKGVLHLSISGFMRSPIVSCLPTDTLDAAMARMTMARIRHFPVIRGGKLLGIVSIGDLVKCRLDERALEAAVLLDLTRMHSRSPEH